jgi:hypothetical protein
MAENQYSTQSSYKRSFESESGVKFASRVEVTYTCENGHKTQIPFSSDADIPISWICYCGAEALKNDEVKEVVEKRRRAKSHWDAILDRRPTVELNKMLKDRLKLYNEGKISI